MCVIRDECVLVGMLLLQLMAGLPVMALMKLCGVAFVVLYVFGVLLSLSLTFAPRIRCCCHSFVTLIHDYGICVFLLTHMALLSMSSYTLYMFLLPFLKAHDFDAYCATQKLSDNLSHTGCERLQGETETT